MFFKVNDEIFQKVKDYTVGVIVAQGFSEANKWDGLGGFGEEILQKAHAEMTEKDVKNIPEIAQYRTAMNTMGVNPNKFRSATEALLRRVKSGDSIKSGIDMVDLGNYISVKHKLAIGMHNIDSFSDDMEVRMSNENDFFDNDEHHADQSEPVYVTGGSVRTRNWLWQQTEAGRTSTVGAENLLIVIDAFEDRVDDIIKARDEFAYMLRTYYGCEVRVGLVSERKPAFKIAGLTEMEKSVEDDLKIILKGSANHTDESEFYDRILQAKQEGRPLRIKLGLDPSAPDLHLGHAVVLRKIRQFQELGHKAVIIFGDFTGMIGDPSGKTKARKPLTFEQVRANAKTYQDQIYKILDESKTEVHFNSTWLNEMNFADVLTLCSKTTVARILERDDFTTRFKNHTPIGLHEFLYPLMQSYDSVAIKADLEMGGTDQTFNITMGRRIMQAYDLDSQLTLFMPLLEGMDGIEKMSKSLNNYVGIYETPKVMYEKVMSIPDHLIIKYFNLCTDLHPDEIEKMQRSLDSGTNPRDIKMKLAYEITLLYSDENQAKEAEENFVAIYQKGEVATDAPTIHVVAGDNWGYALIDALAEADGMSKSEIRRLFKQNAVSINNEKVTDPTKIDNLNNDDIVKIGKNKFFKLSVD